MMPELYEMRGKEDDYISLYQKRHENLEQLMQFDHSEHLAALDKAWNAKNPET